MKRISEWVANNLDPVDQELIAREGAEVSSMIWTLTNEEEDVARDVFHRYSQDIWDQLLKTADGRGTTPLSILDGYAKRNGETICSPESFEITGLIWAIERTCFLRTFTQS